MYQHGGHRQTHSMIIESSGQLSPVDDRIASRSQASKSLSNDSLDKQRIGFSLIRNDKGPKSRLPNNEGPESPRTKEKQKPSDMELMKERFSKLLLGEDMSGGGKGVSSALALSNAITNLAASVFGEQRRLEPMAPDRKARWKKEIDWLLSVTDYIVEFVPSNQKSKDGINMEIMTTRQRIDLLMNIPALRKLDTMLIDCLNNFRDQNEFSYVSKDDESEKGNKRKDDKWWIPTPKVPPKGLSEASRKWIQYQKDSVNQVLKAAMAINAQVLAEMAIPENYIDSLPKNGRASLGDSIYRNITVDDCFDPDWFLSMMDLTSEHKILDLKNRIEASVVIWKRKMNAKDGKSAWGSAVSLEKRELFEERAETILLFIKHRYPGLPQSSLDISKIQFNRDVGHAVLESYSRVLESLAFTVISQIDDVLHADNQARNASGEQKRLPRRASSLVSRSEKFSKADEADTPTSMTLSDFMGWNLDQAETETKKDSADESLKEKEAKTLNKPPSVLTNTKISYIEKLENLGSLRSPTSRH